MHLNFDLRGQELTVALETANAIARGPIALPSNTNARRR